MNTSSARAAPTILLVALFVALDLPSFGQTGSFVQVPGSLAQISVGADGTVWGVDSHQNIFTYDSTAGALVQVPGALTQIAVGNANAVWGINAQNLIFRWDAGSSTWTNIPGSLMQIAVGADGDVWGFNINSQTFHYNQQTQNWDYFVVNENFPPLDQIAVGNDGSVYAVNNWSPAYYQLFQYTPDAPQFAPFVTPGGAEALACSRVFP